jgi:hypothetical protein
MPTSTYTATSLDTPTITLTPTMTPDKQGIDNILVYPNPFNPAMNPVLNFGFTLRQKDCDSAGIRIFTDSFRKIRDEKVSGSDKDTAINNARLVVQAYKFGNLASGTYYYYIYAEKSGITTRSKVDILIIIR